MDLFQGGNYKTRNKGYCHVRTVTFQLGDTFSISVISFNFTNENLVCKTPWEKNGSWFFSLG